MKSESTAIFAKNAGSMGLPQICRIRISIMDHGNVHFASIANNTDVQLCLRGTCENNTSRGVKIIVCWQNVIKMQGARGLD